SARQVPRLLLLSTRARRVMRTERSVPARTAGESSGEACMQRTLGRWWSCGLGAGALLMAFSAPAAEVPEFEGDPFWPTPLPNNWTLGQVAGVAVDERDHVWIMQRPRSLSRLHADGP